MKTLIATAALAMSFNAHAAVPEIISKDLVDKESNWEYHGYTDIGDKIYIYYSDESPELISEEPRIVNYAIKVVDINGNIWVTVENATCDNKDNSYQTLKEVLFKKTGGVHLDAEESAWMSVSEDSTSQSVSETLCEDAK